MLRIEEQKWRTAHEIAYLISKNRIDELRYAPAAVPHINERHVRASQACRCRHQWNTFDTGGICPGCLHQWNANPVSLVPSLVAAFRLAAAVITGNAHVGMDPLVRPAQAKPSAVITDPSHRS